MTSSSSTPTRSAIPEYVDLLLERGLLAPHGLLLADNVLWKGRVLELLAPECAAAADAVDGRERRSLALRDALHGFNLRVAADPRLFSLGLYHASWGYAEASGAFKVAAMPRVRPLSLDGGLDDGLEGAVLARPPEAGGIQAD